MKSFRFSEKASRFFEKLPDFLQKLSGFIEKLSILTETAFWGGQSGGGGKEMGACQTGPHWNVFRKWQLQHRFR
jgi:hypothetical protein